MPHIVLVEIVSGIDLAIVVAVIVVDELLSRFAISTRLFPLSPLAS